MIIKVFATKDIAADMFSQPMFFVNTAVAIRSFTDQANDPNPQNTMHKYPEQFALYELGEYDDVKGDIKPLENGAQKVIRAVDVLRQPQ